MEDPDDILRDINDLPNELIDPALRMQEREPESSEDDVDPRDRFEPDTDSEVENDDELEDDDEDEAGPSRPRGRPKGKGKDKQADDEDAAFSRMAGLVSRPEAADELYTAQRLNIREMAQLDEDDEIAQPARRAKRRPRRRKRPDPQVVQLLGQGNMAFIDGDTKQAIEIFLEVIRRDPYQLPAWTSLASCYSEQGKQDLARQMRFFAAHVDNEVDPWKDLAQEYKELGLEAELLYCLRKALRLEPNDVDTLWELTDIYRREGKTGRAVNAFRKIIQAQPAIGHDFNLLNDFLPLLVEAPHHIHGAQIYRDAFDWHVQHFDGPADVHPRSDGVNTMDLEHIIRLIDLTNKCEQLEEALLVLRRGQRWLQGRKDQQQFDAFDDDREYDPDEHSRGEEEGQELARFPLEIDLRHRLALIRTRMGDDDEADIHIEVILALETPQNQNTLLELGEALLERERWERALDVLSQHQSNDEIADDPKHVYAISQCYQQLKDYPRAEEALRWVIEVDPNHLEAKLRLANVLEETGQRTQAYELVMEVIRRQASRDTSRTSATTGRLTKGALEEQMRQKMRSLWEDVQRAEAGIQNGEAGALDEFVAGAGTMVENFRLARSNFTKNRGVSRVLRQRKSSKKSDLASRALEIQDRLERAMGFDDDADEEDTGYQIRRTTDFYGLDCEKWLNLVIKANSTHLKVAPRWRSDIQYSCVLMVKAEEDFALDILEHVIWAGLFNNRRSEVALRLTTIAAAMRIHAHEKVVENCRKLGQMSQFRMDPFLLMLACIGGGGMRAMSSWSNIVLQRFLRRELQIWDDAVRNYRIHWNPVVGRWAPNLQVGYSRRHNRTADLEAAQEEDDLDDQSPEPDDEDENENENDDVEGPSKPARKSAARRKEDEEPAEPVDADGDDEEEAPLAPPTDDKEVPRPKGISPILNALYGQQMLVQRSYQSALFYLLRAHSIAPHDPFLCLLIAQGFFGRCMNRQADNRNYMVVQGMAFLSKYRQLSPKDPVTLEEVEYNYARAFHGLGVTHLAVIHYERVLESVKTRMDASADPHGIRRGSLAMESAHNLILLYTASGSFQLVKERSSWLAI